MFPTFVICLREGVEASLIVGILAAFLVKQGHREALRLLWAGVGIATGLCLAIGIALQALNNELPQKQQEGLETVVGTIAVGFVTYMIVWMKRHSRELKSHLEHSAGEAIANGSTMALIAMAFLAVLREGFETAVFLLAAFQNSQNKVASTSGAILGLVVAVVLGGLLYRGGVRINLARFFKVTGALLVVVAAGLVASALHTAHEAGWLNALQTQAFDLRWLVAPGSLRAALLTGMLGLQPLPVVAEVLGWTIYLVPVMLFVLWPSKRRPKSVVTTKAPKTYAATGRTTLVEQAAN